jgi:hypothetical protein
MTALTRSLEPKRVALAVGAVIVFLGTLGALHLLAPSMPLSAFSLDGERTVPAVFSAALLLGAGALAWRISVGEGARSLGSAGFWRFMGAFFAFMALDELLAIHERVSASVTGISWQVFYAPATVSAVIAWSVILRRLPSGTVRGMWVAGAGAWFVSQLIEAFQWDGNRLVHEWTFVPEEMLEMAGSLLWGLSLLIALRMRERSERTEPDELETSAEPLTEAPRRAHDRRRRRLRRSHRVGQRSGTPTSRT